MKKGFTLVELLAVIVILAIIALIATPIIINIINDAKEASALRSAEGYMRAVENTVALSNLKESKITDGIYNVKDENIKAEYSGNGPTIGSITITNGIVTSAKLCIDNVSIDYEENENKLSSNNYCLKNELVVDGEKIENEQNLSSLTIDKKAGTNIICNNGVTITEEEENKLKIDNIVGKVECKFSNSVVDSVTNMDDTKNYILMLSDETISSTLNITKNKNLLLNLNSKTITYNGDNSTIGNSGILNIIGDGSTITGGKSIIVSGNSETNINGGTYNGIWVYNNSKLELNNTINRYSDNTTCTTDCFAINVFDNGCLELNEVSINQTGSKEHTLRLDSTASADIYDSNFKCEKDYCIYSKSTGDLNIYNTKIDAFDFAVKLDAAGTLYSENNEFHSETIAAIMTNPGSGNTTVNINGGKYTSKFITIYNYSEGTINISDEKGKVYIASYNSDDSSQGIWDHKAIANISSGNININGAVADSCGQTENTTGICIYNEWGRSVMNEVDSKGTIKINGASVISKDYHAIENVKGIVYLCGTYISGGTHDLYQNTPSTPEGATTYDGTISYNSNVTLKNGTMEGASQISKTDNLICTN